MIHEAHRTPCHQTRRATSSPLLQAAADSSLPSPGVISDTDDDDSEDSKGEKFFSLYTPKPAQLVPAAALTHVTGTGTALRMAMPCGKLVTQGIPSHALSSNSCR